MGAEEIAFKDTLDFLVSRLAKSARLLEVGAGGGELAALLAWRGFEVSALDRDVRPELQGAASQNPKLHVVQEDFLNFRVDDPKNRFDAVLFARSLHHISPLHDALERALEVLRPGGVLLAEEFSLEAPDRETATFYYEALDLLSAAGFMKSHGSSADEPLDRWQKDHEEDPPL